MSCRRLANGLTAVLAALVLFRSAFRDARLSGMTPDGAQRLALSGRNIAILGRVLLASPVLSPETRCWLWCDRLKAERIRNNDLNAAFEEIILPHDNSIMVKSPGDGAQVFGYMRPAVESTPPEYRVGFGHEGVEAPEAFVKAGATVVTFGQAGTLAIAELNLPDAQRPGRPQLKGILGPGKHAPGRRGHRSPSGGRHA